jgi:hypothetical protein
VNNSIDCNAKERLSKLTETPNRPTKYNTDTVRSILENQDKIIADLYDTIDTLSIIITPITKDKLPEINLNNVINPPFEEHSGIYNTVLLNNIRLDNLRMRIIELNALIEV